jgi:3-oxoacyl-[acyl-carrier-protein] synthase II
MNPRDVVITGIGLVSSLGEGADAHWERLTSPRPEPLLDRTRFAPYTVHPLPEIDWGLQIAKRGDQRQMETWQRLGTYAAGLALDDSGVKSDEGLCATMDMVVAAGGGERDEAVDAAILAASESRSDVDVLLNEKLTTELRPTLFLAQLSNLLAGNISIVHKVTGSSRTFMGEEGAGVAAVETAAARIRSGQSTHILVGAAFQTEHPDMLLSYELGHYLHRGDWRPVWQRRDDEGGGVVTGSGAAFLVLESREHAQKRGRPAYASLKTIVSGRANRRSGALDGALAGMLGEMGKPDGDLLAISGASGADEATAAEKSMFYTDGGIAARGFATMTGHLKEAQFPFAVALAALALQRGSAYPAFDPDNEKPFSGAPELVLATAVGYNLYEGMALVAAMD